MYIEDYTLLTNDRLQVIKKFANECKDLEGEFIEMGVYRGGAALAIAKSSNRMIHLFDSFKGLPKPSDIDKHREGQFNENRLNVEKVLMLFKVKYEIHEGFIPDTFKDCNIDKVAFAHVDLDLYEGTKSAIEFLKPRMVKGGIIIFDAIS